jgi:hypothetical protein
LKLEVKPNNTFTINSTRNRICNSKLNSEVFNFCEGDSTIFSTELYDGYQYTWEINDTLTSSTDNQTNVIYFSNESDQKIQVTAINTENGCVVSVTKSIFVKAPPNPEIKVLNISSDSILICKGQKLRFENLTDSSTNNLYLWEVIDTNDQIIYSYSTELQESFTYIFGQSGAFTVRLTARSCFGCEAFTEFTVIVSDLNSVTIVCPSVVCQDDQKEVMYEAKDTCSTYTWSVIGSTNYRVDSNKIWVIWDSFPTNGFGYVKLQTSGCSGEVCEGETIIEVPILPTVGEISGEKSFCSPIGESSFEVPMWPGASYKWSIIPANDSTLTISKGANAHEVFVIRDGYVGSFRIKVKVEHPLADCSFEREDTVLSHHITLANDTICYGSNPTFEFDSHGESIDSATWTFRNFTVSIDNSNEVNIDSTYTRTQGLFDLKVGVKFANGDFCNTTAKILIRPIITPPFISGPQVVCLDSNYTYSANRPNHAGIIDWDVINGTIISEDSISRRVVVNWTVSGKNNKALSARYRLGECYSTWISFPVVDIDSLDQIIMGNPSPCEDTEESYYASDHPTDGFYSWILNPVFGEILNSSVYNAQVRWHMVSNDTTIILKYRDSICGTMYEFDYPVTIVNRYVAEITNSAACAGKDILFSVNVKANNFIWDFGDGTIISTPSDSISHNYADRGFYTVNVKWTNALGCVTGFSATKEIELQQTIKPYVRVYNNANNEFISCLTSDTVEIRFHANEFNIPGLKYRWFIDDIPQTDDSSNTLIRSHPIDFNFTNVFVKLYIEGMICTDTSYTLIDTCLFNPGCTPRDTALITNVIDSACFIRNIYGAFLPSFTVFLYDTVNISPNPMIEHNIYPKGEWFFEDVQSTRKYILGPRDLDNQIHEYQGAGDWLIFLTGNARDSEDSTKICHTYDSEIETIPIVSDFIYTFNCDDFGYLLQLKSDVSYLSGYEPSQYKYILNDAEYYSAEGEAEIPVYEDTLLVCLELTQGDDKTCSKCKLIVKPAELLSPEIKVNDTICANSVLQFDIMDANFTDDITDYLWDFGDGVQSRIRRPSHVFNVFNTTKEVKLYVTNKWGCMKMSSKSVYIMENTLEGNITVDSMECISHKQLNFNKTDGRSPVTYTWNTSDTTSSIMVGQSGLYKITVTDPYGCKIILNKDVIVSESFTNELQGLDSICSNMSNPTFTFFGNDALFDYFVTKKEMPSGTEDTILYSGTNTHTFTFDIDSITGFYRIIIRAYSNGTSTVCDSIIHDITINESNIPLIQDSLYSCKPYTYVLTETHDYNLEWFSLGRSESFFLGSGPEVDVHKGGKYIGVYKNSHGCIESDTIEIENQINLTPFISGCYDICDTTLENGIVYVPMLDDNTIYNWWRYKHLDSNFVIKQGFNSKVDSFLLQKRHEGKMYLVVESLNGCIDSSDLLCLKVKECIPPIDCDTVSMTCPHLSFIKDTFECDSMFGYYSVFGDIVVGNDGFTLCTPNPFIIDDLEWIEQPTITITGHTIHFSGGKLRMHVDSCTGEINISVRLCKDGAECIQELAPYDFECWHNTCGLYYYSDQLKVHNS